MGSRNWFRPPERYDDGDSGALARGARDFDLAPEEPPFRGGYADEDDRPRRTRRRRYEEDEDEAEPRPRKRSPSVPQMDGLVKAGFWGVLVLIALVSVGTWYAVRTARRAPFRAQMVSYLAAPTGVANPNAPRQGPRKMVVVDVQDKDVDDLHFNLPDDLRAATPDEVNTVIQLRWNQAAVGTYSSGLAEQRDVFRLLVTGRLDPAPLVTHRLPLSRFAEAVALARDRRALKVLLTPEGEA